MEGRAINNPVAPPPKMSIAEDVLTQLQISNNRLIDTIGELESRLSPLLCHPKELERAPEEQIDPIPPYLSEVRDCTASTIEARKRLSSIIERLGI